MQIRLWKDCYNNCTFCSLGDKPITHLQSKKARINKLLALQDEKIGIIGGEFFEGQLLGCENEWLYMVQHLQCRELFITANLINEQYLLNETLQANPQILICTSYDTIGRFKSMEQKEHWLERVNSIHRIMCTIIPTQDMIGDTFIDKIQCPIGLCEPHLGLEWYRNVDKKEYHQHLIRENRLFNLPNRERLLDWITKHPNVSMKNYRHTHFNTIMGFDENNNIIAEEQNRFDDNNFMAECGHPYFSRCYSDSEKCLACDCEEI